MRASYATFVISWLILTFPPNGCQYIVFLVVVFNSLDANSSFIQIAIDFESLSVEVVRMDVPCILYNEDSVQSSNTRLLVWV